MSYESLVNDYPFLRDILPDNLVRDIDTLTLRLQTAVRTEQSALDTCNRTIDAHNAGILTMSDYVGYDNFRHTVYNTQVAWVRSARAALNALPGGSVVANRIPWPGWLKPLRPETPRNVTHMRLREDVAGTAGLGAAGVDDLAACIAIVAGALLVGYVAQVGIEVFAEAWNKTILTLAQSRTIAQVVETRRRALAECRQAGSSLEECQRVVQQAIPAPSQAAIDSFLRNRGDRADKGPLWYVGLVTVSVAGLGLLYYGYRNGWFGDKPGMGRVSRRRGVRGLGAPTRVTSLKDERTPSRYYLEVE